MRSNKTREKIRPMQSVSPLETDANELRLRPKPFKKNRSHAAAATLHTFTSRWMLCSSCVVHEKRTTKWITKSLPCTQPILVWQRRADLHVVMTIHKTSGLLISEMERLSTANSGLVDNRWVFTSVISSDPSILNAAPLILLVGEAGGTPEAGMLRESAALWS